MRTATDEAIQSGLCGRLDCFGVPRLAALDASQCWVDGPRRHQMCQAGRVMTTTSERTVRYEHYHNWA